MADAEVFRRIDELMYFKYEFHLIDPSLKRLSGGFIRRIEEHFTPVEGQAPLLDNYPDLTILQATTEKIRTRYSEANAQPRAGCWSGCRKNLNSSETCSYQIL